MKTSSTFIIAEAGVNHNGSLDSAKQLIDVAASAGVDAIKFQTYKAENLVTTYAAKAKYQKENTKRDETQLEMLKRYELSYSSHRELFDYCKRKKILFMSTPFDKESVSMLDEMGMIVFKIPSGEITNKPLIQFIASKNKPIILSTGMSNIDEIKSVVNWIKEITSEVLPMDSLFPPLTLLHCVSNYPARMEDVNLLALQTMKRAFKLPVGYSDHTLGIEVSVAAVTLGAEIIEKHFTLSKDMEGPDHKASLEPEELKAMVSSIRNIEKAMGNGKKNIRMSEKEISFMARKSIVAKKHIIKNDVFTEENITAKRPGTGISPAEWDHMLGQKAKRDFKTDELIEI